MEEWHSCRSWNSKCRDFNANIYERRSVEKSCLKRAKTTFCRSTRRMHSEREAIYTRNASNDSAKVHSHYVTRIRVLLCIRCKQSFQRPTKNSFFFFSFSSFLALPAANSLTFTSSATLISYDRWVLIVFAGDEILRNALTRKFG